MSSRTQRLKNIFRHVSAGAVIIPDGKAGKFHELYAVADEALYISKAISGNSLTFGPDAG